MSSRARQLYIVSTSLTSAGLCNLPAVDVLPKDSLLCWPVSHRTRVAVVFDEAVLSDSNV